jgi:hypothetical protein
VTRTLDAFELLRDSKGGCVVVTAAAERLPVPTKSSPKGEPKGLKIAVRLVFGDSKRPYCGRGGRSGVDLPLFGSGTDAERVLAFKIVWPS